MDASTRKHCREAENKLQFVKVNDKQAQEGFLLTLCVTMLNTMGLDCHTTVFSHALVWTDSRYFLSFESVKVSMQTLQFLSQLANSQSKANVKKRVKK